MGLRVLIDSTAERFRAEPWYYANFASWLAQGVGSWLVLSGVLLGFLSRSRNPGTRLQAMSTALY